MKESLYFCTAKNNSIYMNNNKYPHLTSPIQLGKVTFRNRIFSAPMGATDITADCCA